MWYDTSTQNVRGVRHIVNTIDAGARLRQLRGNTPAKQTADEIGVSESALLMYERGERNPRDDIKVKIAQHYGVSVGDIFFPEDYTNRNT